MEPNPNPTLRLLRLQALGCVLLLIAGCGQGHGQYTPQSDEARSALEAALNAWHSGQTIDSVSATPPVRVIDAEWRGGQKIEKFEILDETDGVDGTRLFSVRVAVKKPPGDREINFVVHGRDPVWVYREEDYNRMLRMDNNPVKARTRAPRR